MASGIAAFLSAVLLGLVALYATAKGHWRRKKIFLWLLGVSVVVPALAAVGTYIYLWIESQPRPQTSFWDIPLGSTASDVRFRKGKPTKTDGALWIYKTEVLYGDSLFYVVRFTESGKLWYVLYYGPGHELPSLQGITNYSSQETIVEKFGAPTYVSISKDGLRRLLSYSKYNLVFELSRNRVTALGMYDGTGPPPIQWDVATEH